MEPVSYTHLDVYKRQAVARAMFMLSWELPWRAAWRMLRDMEEEVPAGASVKVSTPRAEGPPSLKWMLMGNAEAEDQLHGAPLGQVLDHGKSLDVLEFGIEMIIESFPEIASGKFRKIPF